MATLIYHSHFWDPYTFVFGILFTSQRFTAQCQQVLWVKRCYTANPERPIEFLRRFMAICGPSDFLISLVAFPCSQWGLSAASWLVWVLARAQL